MITIKNYAVILAWVASILFLALAILGFISDSRLVERALFETNIILNLTHLITAIGLAIVAKQGVDASISLIRVFGSAYMLISAIGFIGINMQTEGQSLHVDFLNYVEFSLGVTLYILGSFLKNRRNLAVVT